MFSLSSKFHFWHNFFSPPVSVSALPIVWHSWDVYIFSSNFVLYMSTYTHMHTLVFGISEFRHPAFSVAIIAIAICIHSTFIHSCCPSSVPNPSTTTQKTTATDSSENVNYEYLYMCRVIAMNEWMNVLYIILYMCAMADWKWKRNWKYTWVFALHRALYADKVHMINPWANNNDNNKNKRHDGSIHTSFIYIVYMCIVPKTKRI